MQTSFSTSTVLYPSLLVFVQGLQLDDIVKPGVRNEGRSLGKHLDLPGIQILGMLLRDWLKDCV